MAAGFAASRVDQRREHFGGDSWDRGPSDVRAGDLFSVRDHRARGPAPIRLSDVGGTVGPRRYRQLHVSGEWYADGVCNGARGPRGSPTCVARAGAAVRAANPGRRRAIQGVGRGGAQNEPRLTGRLSVALGPIHVMRAARSPFGSGDRPPMVCAPARGFRASEAAETALPGVGSFGVL